LHVLFFPAGGEKDDGDFLRVLVLFQHTARFESGHAGHHDVHKNQVWRVAERPKITAKTIRDDLHFIACSLEPNFQGGTNLQSGAITWVDPDYDERTGEVLRPIQLDHSGLQWGTDYEERVEKVIQEAFFLNVLNLPPIEAGEKMTATEVDARMREYIQRATPLFEPMDLEYNGKLCQATYALMDRVGAFGSMFDRPAPLRGRNIEFKFTNPLVQAEGERKLTSFTKMGQLLGAAMQFDPNTRVDTDIRAAYRDAYEGTGGPSTWLLPKDKADQLVQQQQQQQEAMEAANQVGHVAEQGGKAAAAVTNVGQAATSLQDAGLAG